MWHGGIGGLGTLAAFGKVWCGIGELGECGIGALGHWAYLEGDRPAVGVAARPVKGADAAARTKEVPGDAAAQQVHGERMVSAWWVYGVCMAGDAAAELGLGLRLGLGCGLELPLGLGVMPPEAVLCHRRGARLTHDVQLIIRHLQ